MIACNKEMNKEGGGHCAGGVDLSLYEALGLQVGDRFMINLENISQELEVRDQSSHTTHATTQLFFSLTPHDHFHRHGCRSYGRTCHTC
jgi:hypothetical protein